MRQWQVQTILTVVFQHGSFFLCVTVLRQGNVVRAAGYEEGPITGRVPDPEAHAKAVHEFNQHVAKDARVQAVILPLFDGMTLIRKA